MDVVTCGYFRQPGLDDRLGHHRLLPEELSTGQVEGLPSQPPIHQPLYVIPCVKHIHLPCKNAHVLSVQVLWAHWLHQ